MGTGAQRPRILMVEDDSRLSAMVAEYLGDNGLEVDVRGTVADGVSNLDRGDYDAVILDVMLPDGDGIELCRTLRPRSSSRGRSPPRRAPRPSFGFNWTF